MSDTEGERLFNLEEKLEDDAYKAGVDAFYQRIRDAAEAGTGSTVGAAPRLLRGGVTELAARLTEMCEPAPGRQPASVKWIKQVTPERAAYIAVKVVLDGLSSFERRTEMVLDIADMIVDELRYQRFKEVAPELFEWKLRSFKTNSYDHMARSMDAAMRIRGIDVSDITMTQAERRHVGGNLLDEVSRTTGLIAKLTDQKSYKEKNNIVVADPDTIRWLETANEKRAGWWPALMPMVVPPLPWQKGVLTQAGVIEGLERGGYRFRQKAAYPLVSQANRLRLPEERPQEGVPLRVHEVVNALQNVAFRVNAWMLDVIEELVKTGGNIAGLPLSDIELGPDRPKDIATNAAALKQWKRETKVVFERNRERKREAMRVRKTLIAAQTLRDEAATFYPFFIDARGRAYPIPRVLSPQGDDLDRSLLLFARAESVNPDAARALAIHGANCYGETPLGKVSRMTLPEREGWIMSKEVTREIIRAADSPKYTNFWAKADEPLQFLAFCREWANLIRANDRGEEYACGLPVHIDGSANAIQLWSALLRDKKSGKQSNVSPSDRPQDPYGIVADAVLKQLEVLAPEKSLRGQMAKLWLGAQANEKDKLIDRSLVKKPVMTYTYSATLFGCQEHIEEKLRAHPQAAELQKHFELTTEGRTRSGFKAACRMLARVVWDAIGLEFTAPVAGMDWLKAAIVGILAQNKSPHWTVPITKLVVEQRYFHQEEHEVNTAIAGGTVLPGKTKPKKVRTVETYYEDTEKVDRKQHRQSIAPNVIHSLDAAIMMRTVELAGDIPLSMVHDSFASTPANAALLAQSCRLAFSELFRSHDVLGDLHRELASQWQHPEDCPQPPPRGSLDVAEVYASPHAYS